MRKSKPYRSVPVKQVLLNAILVGRGGMPAVLGVDISKETLVLVLWWKQGEFEQPWTACNPSDIRLVVELARELSRGRSLVVAMESSGTYGDALRQALGDAGIPVSRVSAKASHDYAEIFDGVPSQHDGKDAAVIAELCGNGKSVPWPWREPADWEQEMEQCVNEADALRQILQARLGQFEARLARHWPEALTLLPPSSMALAKAIACYGGAQALSQDPEASRRLAAWASGRLKPEKIAALVESAGRTLGVRQTPVNCRGLKRLARNIRGLRRKLNWYRRRIKELARESQTLQSMGQVVGLVTACVLWVCLGDPRDYSSAAAYQKAMGLNLTERSSGKYKGHLKISKRGSAMVRRWLYLAALRQVHQHRHVKGWYQRKRSRMAEGWRPRPGYKPRPAIGAVVAVMRKLSRGLHAVAGDGRAYDPRRLFSSRQKVARRTPA